MRAASSSRMPSSPAARAQSRTSPKAKAVWSCSPIRIGCVSFGTHSRDARRPPLSALERLPAPRAQRSRLAGRPTPAARRRAGAARRDRTAARTTPVPSPVEVRHLAGDVLRRQALRQRRPRLGGERRVGEQPREPRQQPVPVDRRVPVVAAVERRRQLPRRLRRRRPPGARGRSCSGTPGARRRAPARRAARRRPGRDRGRRKPRRWRRREPAARRRRRARGRGRAGRRGCGSGRSCADVTRGHPAWRLHLRSNPPDRASSPGLRGH